MTDKKKDEMSPPLPVGGALLAAAGVGLFSFWLYSLDGTRGLLEWMPKYRNIFLCILAVGCLPALLLIPARHSRPFRFVSIVVSCLVIAGTSAGFMLLFNHTRKIPTHIPVMNKLELTSEKSLAHLAFSSDMHIGSGKNNLEATRSILRTVNAGGYDAFFILGDIAEMGVPGMDFENAASLFAKEIPDVAIATVMGNHDALIGGTYRYQSFFNNKLYYRIDSGKTHIIALNLLWGSESMDSAQKKWLVATLASIPTEDTTIVIDHCYFWASGYTDKETGIAWYDHPALTAEISPLLEQGGVDLVISGHNHFMEYLERPAADGTKGTAYVVIGAMGGMPDPEREYSSPWSLWYKAKQFGFLDLTVYENRMELAFRSETGEVLHTVVR